MQEIFNQNMVQAFNEGKPHAIIKWYKTYYPGIVHRIYLMTGGSPEATDLASEVIAKVLERKGRFQTVKNICNYEKKVTRTICKKFLRERKERIKNEEDLAEHIKNLEAEAERKTEVRNTYRVLNYFAYENLPSQSRRVFHLCYQEELSNREIAERLNISVKAVEHHKSYAFNKLKRKFGIEMEENQLFLFFILSIPFAICYYIIQKLLS
jgi:RNA polymerase sigma factor (sigma-70 family)